MKVIFLEDNLDRQREFQTRCPNSQNAIGDGIEPIDTLLIGRSAMDVVRSMKYSRQDAKLVIVHAEDPIVARRMVFELMDCGYRVYREQFGSPEFWRLATLATAEEHLEAVRAADSLKALPAEDRIAVLREIVGELQQELSKVGICPDCRNEIDHEVDEPFASCGCVGTMEWTGPIPTLSLMRSERRTLERENDTLRAIVARTQTENCVYCGRDDMTKCSLGLAGCSRAQDIVCAGDTVLESMKRRMREVESAALHNRIVIRILHKRLDPKNPELADMISMVSAAHAMDDALLRQLILDAEGSETQTTEEELVQPTIETQ